MERCLRALFSLDEMAQTPVQLVKNSVREVLAELRARILAGEPVPAASLGLDELMPVFVDLIHKEQRPRLRRVINATGVVIHTNLGRSLLPPGDGPHPQAGSRYSNLEFDLATGKRGSRYSHVEDLLCELTGAEAALVVNNNAAAVLLVLDTLAKDREVIVSRGQLVEIGGSFRIPEVMAAAAPCCVEVGATNRTHLRDYEKARDREPPCCSRCSCSNFRMIGFTAEVTLPELVQLAGRRRICR